MRRFVEEADRRQWTLLPECLDDFIDESNPVRVIDVFVDTLDLTEMSFEGVEPAATGRPSYHPSVLLKLYIYGYLNRVQSSRRLEREAGRNVEVMWLLGRAVDCVVLFQNLGERQDIVGAGCLDHQIASWCGGAVPAHMYEARAVTFIWLRTTIPRFGDRQQSRVDRIAD